MPNFPTKPDEVRRWLKVVERNITRDDARWWAKRTTLETYDFERVALGPRKMDVVSRFLSVPATAEGQVLIHEVLAMTSSDQARWFLREMDGDIRNSGDRVRAHRAAKRLREETDDV